MFIGAPTFDRAAIVLLVPSRTGVRKAAKAGAGGVLDWDCTLRALRSLRHLEDEHRADVLIFHDECDALGPSDLEALVRAAAPRHAYPRLVRLAQFPPGVNVSSRSSWRTSLRVSPSQWGYQHMIRFFFADLFEGLLRGYVFWMRLDSDAHFTRPFASPFKLLQQTKLAYLHYHTTFDCGSLVLGLPPLIARLAQAGPVGPAPAGTNASWEQRAVRASALAGAVHRSASGGTCTIESKLWPTTFRQYSWGCPRGQCVLGFYNNAEVGRVAAFQTEGMRAFRRAVAQARGIYTRRWGDALLRRISIEFEGMVSAPLPPDFVKSYSHRCEGGEGGMEMVSESDVKQRTLVADRAAQQRQGSWNTTLRARCG